MLADESTVMELLICVGQARSGVTKAITASRQWERGWATDLMASSEAACWVTRKTQTALIGQGEGCRKVTVNLILVHIQDHSMTAMLCQDLAKETIALCQERSA